MANPTKRKKRDVWSSDSDDQPAVKTARLKADPISSSPSQSNESKYPASVRSLKAKFRPGQNRARAANIPQCKVSNYRPTQIPSSKANEKTLSSISKHPVYEGRTEDKSKSSDVTAFFPRQTLQKPPKTANQMSVRKISSTKKKPSLAIPAENGEMISDWEEEDLDFMIKPFSLIRKEAKKCASTRGSGVIKKEDWLLSKGSQRFSQKENSSIKFIDQNDHRPWAERFAPASLEELAVHKRKVAQTKTWLEEVMSGRRQQSILLMKGAAGTGKTITLKLLAASMNCGVLEWRNPVGSVASSDGFLSMSAQFEEFLGRGGRFGQLELFSADEYIPEKREESHLDHSRRIILIEEFPNTFSSSSTSLQSFRSSLIQFITSHSYSVSIKRNDKPKNPIIPVVIIVSETLLTTSTASADSFTAHRLLGPAILQHPGVEIIDFNPIAPTFLAKALHLLLQKESRKSGRKRIPGPKVLQKLGEVGDIRSAISSLEFLCLRGDTDGEWSSQVVLNKSNKRAKIAPLTAMEIQSLEMVTRREASLGIFHAVGKVVYNRRQEQQPPILPVDDDPERLPSFMSIHSRPKRSMVSINELIDETGTDTQTFVSTLHENYILSCDAAPTCFEFSSLDHVNGCIDALSDSDLLCPPWHGSQNSSQVAGGRASDSYRCDEISFQIAVRGLLFSLPHPVTRKAPGVTGMRMGMAREAHNMFYPTSLKLWRMKEDIESTIDLWVKKFTKGDHPQYTLVTAGATGFRHPKASSVQKSALSSSHAAAVQTPPRVFAGTSARKEMLLERLPYMARIFAASGSVIPTFIVKEIAKVTTFTGISRNDDLPDSNSPDEMVGENWATDEPSEANGSGKKFTTNVRYGSAHGLVIMQPAQTLALSDDDIEDD